MKKASYKYKAFISYRHSDLDKFVAENLHRLIETYKIPSAVVEKYSLIDSNKRRLFRDQEELPLASNLEKPIIDALKSSEFLIVICSPRLKESKWCRKEISNFIKYHGRDNIFCILVEGEPNDVFPPELLYYEEKSKTKTGKEIIKKISCEPLAMDVRGENKKEVLKKIKNELVRIIAPLYYLDYDDIKRRHEERELKRKVRLFRIITIISIIFTVYSFLLFLKIFISSNQLKYDQAITLADASNSLLKDDNRKEAILKAYQSVTKYNNNKLPVTSKGIYELTDSLGVYYTSRNIYPISQFNTSGVVQSIKTDKDKKYLLSYDSSNELILWNLDKEEKIITITDGSSINENKYTFIGNEGFVYQSKNKDINFYNFKGKKIHKLKYDSIITSIVSSDNGNYFEISTDKEISIYKTDSYEKVASYELDSSLNLNSNLYFDLLEENLIFIVNDKSDRNNLQIITYNFINNEVLNNTSINANNVKKVIFKDNNLILLANKKVDLSFNMILLKYQYKSGLIDYQKEYSSEYYSDFSISDQNNTILVSSTSLSHLLDYEIGEDKTDYIIDDHIVKSYSLDDTNFYLLFTSGGEVTTVNSLDYVNGAIVYTGLYNFNLSNYLDYLYTTKGFLAYTNNDNRIIIYSSINNDDIKEIDYEEKKLDTEDYYKTIKVKEDIIKSNKFTREDLISNAFYSNDKKYMFISYSDNTLEIYDVENYKLLNKIDADRSIDTYLGKTNNNEYIISSSKCGYILNKDFDKIAYIPDIYDYKNNKLILKTNSKFYEVKIYSEKELIDKAKKIIG